MLNVEILPAEADFEPAEEAADVDITMSADSIQATESIDLAASISAEKTTTNELPSSSTRSIRTLFKSDGVHITARFFRFGQKTYATPHLTHIHTGKVKADFSSKALVNAGLGGAIGLMLGIMLDLSLATALTLLLFVAGVGFGLALAYLTKNEPHFFLRIKMSSGEVDSIKSSDETYIFALANHLLRAMSDSQAERG